MDIFSSRIKELRLSKNLSQSAVANGADIGLRLYQYYESGEKIPNLATAVKIAEFFDVSLDYLVGRKN